MPRYGTLPVFRTNRKISTSRNRNASDARDERQRRCKERGELSTKNSSRSGCTERPKRPRGLPKGHRIETRRCRHRKHHGRLPGLLHPQPPAGHQHLWSDLPTDVLPFLLPSRFCTSDKFMNATSAVRRRRRPMSSPTISCP